MNTRRIAICCAALAVAAGPALAEAVDESVSLGITISGASGRTVFRNVETINILAELKPTSETGGKLQGELRGRAGAVCKTLAAKPPLAGGASWQIKLAGLKPGPYTAAIRLIGGGGNNTRVEASMTFDILQRPKEPDFFPVSVQFSPVPSGKGWTGGEGPLSEQVLRDTIDNILDHGFTGLETTTHRPKDEHALIMDYAQRRGMIITHHAGRLELFGRNEPPKTCVYSPEYAKAVRSLAERALAGLKDIPRLYNVFTYQDEPFHAGPKSLGYNAEVLAEFKKRHGYDMPADLDSIRDDPKQWLDVINFRSDYFPEGWRQVHRIIKEIDPGFKTVMTHDSHNTFGAGYGSHAQIAIDDVFHWGGDFADMFVFDIYPYMAFDYRFGDPAGLPKPRMSQTHYSFAQMRNLTRAYGKQLGFWVGTYNPTWFKEFLGPELRAQYWSESEMSTTAVAQGADFLLTGYKIPVDARHWDSFGEGLRLIQKAGGRLLKAPKVKAAACMLFPRTHYVQLQEEYFNVGLSFELFLRAFGELDILHEEQITDASLDGYKILVLFDVKLLPKEVAEAISSFVQAGGVVIADCVPNMGKYKERLSVMEELFGVRDAQTGRILPAGHWLPYRTRPPSWAGRPKGASDKSVVAADCLRGAVLGRTIDLTLVSPRPCTATTGEVLIKTASGRPGLIRRQVGKGHVFLLGFCLQDTYFRTWKDENETARGQLRGLIRAITQATGVRGHVWSSNPDVEAAVRANEREGFLFVINHEADNPRTTIRLADLDFEIGEIVDLLDDRPVRFSRAGDAVELTVSVEFGKTLLLRLSPK